MERKLTEIVIQFKQPPVTMFRDMGPTGSLLPNMLSLRVQPDEGFSLRIESKQPGRSAAIHPVNMDFSYGSTLHELPFSAYETLLVDAMEGDMTLFNRGDQVEQAWRIVDPILEAWSTAPPRGLPVYEAGTWGPEAADALIARDGHTWHRPPEQEDEP
jgi:glucose-6-phosphate 1-dehydrogenase